MIERIVMVIELMIERIVIMIGMLEVVCPWVIIIVLTQWEIWVISSAMIVHLSTRIVNDLEKAASWAQNTFVEDWKLNIP